MRKSEKFALLLILVLGLACFLSACGKNSEGGTGDAGTSEKIKTFSVGYGRTDITPDESVPLDSYGNAASRYSTGYLSRIYFNCIAITDAENETLILCSYDITQCNVQLLEDLRKYAKDTYGIKPDFVHLSGTHTHSSVALGLDVPVVSAYKITLLKKAKEALDQAMSDRLPAEMYAGETKTEKMNFVRHYWRADGTSCGDNHGNWSTAEVVSHVKDPDETMRVIKFTRKAKEGDAKDIVLVNWQAHNHLTGGATKYDLSADFSCEMVKQLEKDKNCYATFFQGCAGDLNEQDSRLPENNRTTDFREYGQLLAGYVEGIYDTLDKRETGAVKSTIIDFSGPVNHTKDDLKKVAQTIYNNWVNSNYNGTNAIAEGKPYEIHSPYMASAIVTNANLRETFDIKIQAYAIGDIGWTSVPLEMFDTTGEEIRKDSPFTFTFTQGYTDGSYGYLPTTDAYEYGCYEADTTRWAPGTAEIIRDRLLEALKSIHD